MHGEKERRSRYFFFGQWTLWIRTYAAIQTEERMKKEIEKEKYEEKKQIKKEKKKEKTKTRKEKKK